MVCVPAVYQAGTGSRTGASGRSAQEQKVFVGPTHPPRAASGGSSHGRVRMTQALLHNVGGAVLL